MQIARSCYILLDLSYVQQPYFKLKPEIIEFLVILTRENAWDFGCNICMKNLGNIGVK